MRKALFSLINQSVHLEELIISDDGSDENVPELISDVVSRLNFPVKYVKQKNNGFRLARCRNNGVRLSSGEFLIFLDQDLVHTTNYISTFVETIHKKRFLTSFPVYLSEEVSNNLTEAIIKNGSLENLSDANQRQDVYKQYRKDLAGYFLHKFGVSRKPKVRGGA